jgi:hypothetical protein
MTDRQIKIGIFRLAHPFIIFDRALTGRRINAAIRPYSTAKGEAKWRTGNFRYLAVSGCSSARGEGATYEPEAGMD